MLWAVVFVSFVLAKASFEDLKAAVEKIVVGSDGNPSLDALIKEGFAQVMISFIK